MRATTFWMRAARWMAAVLLGGIGCLALWGALVCGFGRAWVAAWWSYLWALCYLGLSIGCFVGARWLIRGGCPRSEAPDAARPPTPVGRPAVFPASWARRGGAWRWNRTRRATRLGIVAAGLVAVSAGVGAYRYLCCDIRGRVLHSIETQLRQGGATQRVDERAWTHLSIGMSREAVVALLGEAPYKRQSSSRSAGEEEAVKIEYWEYNYASALGATAPHPKAYVVYFDRTGKVSGFRPPTE